MGEDFIVSELLSELKAESTRKSKLINTLCKVLVAALVAILLVVAGFLWYLNQYDFTSYETSVAEGVYAIVDSEGNVITSDLTSDEIIALVEGVMNDGQSSENSSSVED